MNKFRVLPVSHACECPFYVQDTSGVSRCFIKHTIPAHLAVALVEESKDFNPALWDQDCQGQYGQCSVLPLLWNLDADEPAPVEARLVDTGLEDYDPFEEQSNDEEPEESAHSAADDNTNDTDDQAAVESKSEEEDKASEESLNPAVRVSIHKVSNPYQVKADVIVYPSNIVLTVDDPLLNRMSRGKVQEECDKMARPIKMGHVYVTSNGGERSAVVPKAILHAIVAGPSRLVNEQDIKSAIRKSLHVAEEMGAEKVVILPCDCGTHDIADVARVQISAIYTFLNSVETKSITHIFLVMEDEESTEVFEEYFERIFE
jgi:O-acetyl-ADP-ribose deacetylase (regulator of RNase III)